MVFIIKTKQCSKEHLILKLLRSHKLTFIFSDQYPNITWEQEIELCRQSVQVLNAMRPRPAFFIVCGDLVDAMPDRWPDIRREQEKDFLNIYSELDPKIPLGEYKQWLVLMGF